jgi:propanol-preferring alcohol dehydrogenase
VRAVQILAPGRIEPAEVPEPIAGPGQILLRVHACGVCRTDLHELDGEVEIPHPPVIPGHQIVGTVLESAGAFAPGTRVGIPWLGWTDGTCGHCRRGQENLCERARFTGRDIDGGYAELAVADERFCFALPERYGDLEAAPLLCAGLIGFRALRLAGAAERLGLYGFGASAHLVAQVASADGGQVFAFTRPDDAPTQAFARSLGAVWAGGSDEAPPEPLDAAIIFASAGELVPAALRAVRPGGSVVCAGIHMSDIPAFPYEILWGERLVRSVANLTREDAREFLAVAARVPLRTSVTAYPLEHAARALEDLRHGRFEGAAVLEISPARSS